MAGVTVEAIQDSNVLDTTTTDANGDYGFPELPNGPYTVKASFSGFLPGAQQVDVVVGQNTVVNFTLSLLSVDVQGEVLLELTWGAEPDNLDANLWLPPGQNQFWVFFCLPLRGSLGEFPFAQLNRDDSDGEGDETITIGQFFPGTYLYIVSNFSHIFDPTAQTLAASGAQVEVSDSTGLVATIDVPTAGTGEVWKVLEIDGGTGSMTVFNEIIEIGDFVPEVPYVFDFFQHPECVQELPFPIF